MLVRHPLAVVVLTTAACGLKVVGSATNATTDAGAASGPSDTDATDPTGSDASDDGSAIELPTPPGDGGGQPDATAGPDAASDACVLGAVCNAQTDCCPRMWCGRFVSAAPFECQLCLGVGVACNDDVECCGGACTGKPNKAHTCQ